MRHLYRVISILRYLKTSKRSSPVYQYSNIMIPSNLLTLYTNCRQALKGSCCSPLTGETTLVYIADQKSQATLKSISQQFWAWNACSWLGHGEISLFLVWQKCIRLKTDQKPLENVLAKSLMHNHQIDFTVVHNNENLCHMTLVSNTPKGQLSKWVDCLSTIGNHLDDKIKLPYCTQ